MGAADVARAAWLRRGKTALVAASAALVAALLSGASGLALTHRLAAGRQSPRPIVCMAADAGGEPSAAPLGGPFGSARTSDAPTAGDPFAAPPTGESAPGGGSFAAPTTSCFAPPFPPGATPLLLPRVETLLKDELGLRYDFEYEQVCDEERRDCSVRVNKGCLVVALPTLLEWLMEHKPYQQYAVSLPNDAAAREPEEVRRRREEDCC